ncbi:MAG: DUF4147 domain-containing protein, partial [Chloroflexi bacterium]|nr:DUF4147 domain-containing protein [Chloroflexota bacterium]
MNKTNLRFTQHQSHINVLIQAALAAANPATAVSTHIQKINTNLIIANQSFPLNQGNIYLISVGKASIPMAHAAAEIMAGSLHTGIVITKAGQPSDNATAAQLGTQHPHITIHQAAHPVSDERCVHATTAVSTLLQQTTANDLVLFLISGGTSALLTQPKIPLSSWQQINKALLASGCTINEFNCVRRQLDQVKGGGLAQLAAPATCIALILSDVVGNPLSDIGSGPTVMSNETAVDAKRILSRYQIETQVDTAVWQQLTTALAESRETAVATSCHNIIVGDVRIAATAATTAAQELGFTTQLLTAHLEGEAREVGQFAAALAKDAPANHCLILGGETTVTLRGNGIGGRNLETALAAAISLDGWQNCAVTSFATDGDDGPTSTAGATVTGETVGNGRQHNLNPTTYL